MSFLSLKRVRHLTKCISEDGDEDSVIPKDVINIEAWKQNMVQHFHDLHATNDDLNRRNVLLQDRLDKAINTISAMQADQHFAELRTEKQTLEQKNALLQDQLSKTADTILDMKKKMRETDAKLEQERREKDRLRSDMLCSTDIEGLNLASMKRQMVEMALRKSGGNRNLAAKLLGIDRSGLYAYLASLKKSGNKDAQEMSAAG